MAFVDFRVSYYPKSLTCLAWEGWHSLEGISYVGEGFFKPPSHNGFLAEGGVHLSQPASLWPVSTVLWRSQMCGAAV